MSQPPSRLVSSTRLHNLPPGCKVLSCHEAHNVLRSSSTIRLPDGSVVAPLGGELYQVVELPSSCDERCSLRETVQGHDLYPVRPVPDSSPFLTSEWLKYRHASEQLKAEEIARYERRHVNIPCPQMPVFYTGGRVCTCQYCLSTIYTDGLLMPHPSPPLEEFLGRFKQERFSPTLKTADSSSTANGFTFNLSLTTQPVPVSSDEQRRAKMKRFQCMHCEKSFGKSSHLRDHIRTHTGDRPFRCQYCNKAFTQYSNLRTHTRIHTGEKPFRCQHCSKSFTQAVTLRSHTRTHSGDKPYNCKRCSKSFACFSGLKGHIRIHGDTESVSDLEEEYNS